MGGEDVGLGGIGVGVVGRGAGLFLSRFGFAWGPVRWDDGVGFQEAEALVEHGDVAEPAFGFGDLGGRGDGAVDGVEGDLFDLLRGVVEVGVLACGWGFGEVGAGDLEAVEEESGAAGVDVVGGDAAEDLADGGLDGGAVFGMGEVEGGASAAALAWIGDRAAGGVVEVAELLVAEAGALAAAAFGEDVAALALGFGGGCGAGHGVGTPYPL